MTTTKSTVFSVNLSGDTGQFGGTYYVVEGTLDHSSTELVDIQTKALTAFTWSDMGARVSGTGSVSSLISRNNLADGNQAVSSVLNTPAWYTDSTHTDSVASGSVITIRRTTGTGPAITILASTMAASSPLFITRSNSPASTAGFNTTRAYGYVRGSLQSDSVETDAQVIVRAAATWKNQTLEISSSPANAVTFTVRNNAADGNQTISITGGVAAGTILSDTTHTDSLVSGNLIDVTWIQVTSASGNMRWWTAEFVGVLSAQDVGIQSNSVANSSTALAASTSYYWSFGGFLTTLTTEATAQSSTPYALTMTKLRCRIYTNTSATMTLKSRKNGADGNGVVSVTSGTTGNLEDSTHSDSYAALDSLDSTGVTGTLTSLGLKNVYATIDDGSVANLTAYSLTAAEGTYTLSGQAVALPMMLSILAAEGTYTLSGQAVALPMMLSILAAQGAYVVTGFDTLSNLTSILSASFGAYHLNGFDVAAGHNRILNAKRGRYKVRKEKTILRLNSGQSIIWPVDDGEYDLIGHDVVFGQPIYVLTFSAFQNPALIDWATESGAGYVSYLDTNFLVPGDPMSFANVPYLYVFLEDGASEDDVGLLMTVAKNWATDENAPGLGRDTQVYRFRDGYALSLTKNRIRGKGRVFQVRFKSDSEKDFNLRGWAGMIEKNTLP